MKIRLTTTQKKEAQIEQIIEATGITNKYIIELYEKEYRIKKKDKELFNILKDWSRGLDIKFKINKNGAIKIVGIDFFGNIEVDFFVVKNRRKIETIANRIYKSVMLTDDAKYFFIELNTDIQD
ncbi:hypothetical protein AB4865_10430 [Capnocytophaga sp. ARDL2]|uniref:hypothetical protein n=1 Tax=Capnocytophaga sp. ARDL2 TaxID=3238809 RepID=UPI00355864DF